MVIMALDHTREYFHAAGGIDPTDPVHSNLLLYATRWITYLCAPTFLFLSGASVWLRGTRPAQRRMLPRFLLLRGLWLIALELTVIATAFTFHPGYLFLQIIWVIGVGFIVLSAMCRLPGWISLAAGLSIVGGHDLLDRFHDFQTGGTATLIDFIDGRFSFVAIGPAHGVLLYSALGWIGIMLVGYGAGPLFELPRPRRRRLFLALGTALTGGFFLLRLVNRYGDPLPWSDQGELARTAMSFMRVSKYPPSLDFALATLGPAVILLGLIDEAANLASRVLRTFGRVPFFYYILHIYLIHGTAAAAGMIQGLRFKAFTDPLSPPRDFGVPLGWVYVLWLAFVAVLYLPCRWFEGLRGRRTDWWLGYL